MSDPDESMDRSRSPERSSRSRLPVTVTSPARLSKSFLRALSPGRPLIELMNPLRMSHSHLRLGKKRSRGLSSASSRSRIGNGAEGKEESCEGHDCAEPVSTMAKSIVTMLTAASMYAGMELETHTEKHDDLDVNDDIENQVDDDSDGDSHADIDKLTLTDHPIDEEDESKTQGEDSDKQDLDEISTAEIDNDSTSKRWTGSIDLSKSNIILPTSPLRRQSTLFELSVVHKLASKTESKSTSTQRAYAISEKLKTTFIIDDNEEFMSDYPCWLLRDVLLQGHLYLTTHHLLYFAFLPRKQGKVSMEGSIGLKTNHSRRTVKKWAVLRDSTLSIYSSSTDLYFPYLTIDLQYALRAELLTQKHDSGGKLLFGKENSAITWFKLLTEAGSYLFQADSLNTANEWVASLKKHIFASRNKGDHVAIKIPLRNVLDLELTPIFENSQTLRLKVLESSDSYAIDDYYLMFLYGADKTVADIKEAMKDSGNQYEDFTATIEDSPHNLIDQSSDDEIDSDNEASQDSPTSNLYQRFHTSSLIPKALLSPRMYPSTLHKLTKSLSPSFIPLCSKGDASADSNSVLSSNSVMEKVVRYDNDDVPEIILNEEGNVKQLNDSSPSDEASDFLPIERAVSPPPNGFSLETSVDEIDKIYQSQQSKWNPKSLVKGVYNTTASGMSHVTNLGTMWSANPIHYDEANSLERGSEDPYLVTDPLERQESTQRFLKHFSLPSNTKLIASYYAHFIKNVPVYGKIYIGDSQICYRSLLPGTNTLMILPFKDVENVYKEKGFRFGYSGLVVVIHGHEELFFEFGSSESRDDCETLLLKQIDLKLSNTQSDALVKGKIQNDIKLAATESELTDARVRLFESKLSNMYGVNVPIILENNPYIQTDFKPKKSYRFTMLTIGSRGDVQPYIALGKGLLAEGHQVKIVTHQEFQPWIEKHGLSFAPIAGDPAELMNLMVTHGTMSVAFLKDASSKFRGWINDLLASSWESCQDSDILIESPSAMAGVHIAEALGIPYMRAFTMPWTKTRAYPHAFIVPDQKRGGSYNYLTHVMFENVFWRGISGQVNKWRVETLKLPKTNLEHMLQSKIPFLYNISPTVFPPALDFASWIKVTGYWFLDEAAEYDPPAGLVEFIKQARADNKKLIYIGFGSIVVTDPRELTEAVVNAVIDSDVRCILNKGWSDRLGSADSKKIEVDLPPCIYNAGSVPHDWLFSQLDAAVHHGGSGTTGATLRAGLPTIIKPFFGDQFFYANRVVDIGAGIAVRKLNSKTLSKLIKEATSNQRIIQKAHAIDARIKEENGVTVAIDTIYSQLEYAKNLIIAKKDLYGPNLDKRNEELEEAANKNEESWLVV